MVSQLYQSVSNLNHLDFFLQQLRNENLKFYLVSIDDFLQQLAVFDY